MALSPAATRTFLVDSLAARRAQPALLLVSLPAPLLPLESLWAALPSEPAMLWDPPDAHWADDASSGVGLGEAAVGDRLTWRPDAATATECPVERIAAPGLAAGSLRWLGGLPFAGAVAEPPWSELVGAGPMLPRWRYARGRDGCSWHLAVYAPTDSVIEQIEAEFLALHSAHISPPVATAAPLPVHSESLARGRWQAFIERILHAIAAGQVAKVVAARRSTVVFAQPIDVPAVLGRLRAQAPQSIRFALRRGRTTFLGATPELLLRKRGRAIATEALAGTLARADEPLAELSAQLLGSDKDRREHDLVKTALQSRLSPLCEVHTSEIPATPQVRALPHLIHLHTPIRATTRAQKTHAMELLRALHPTPAVGGTPTAEALRLIAAHEPQARGYYAGPIGWYDEHGDGEFAVAIRSGVVLGDTAYIYGGAGIVQGSEPAREYAECAAKMRTLLAALAVPADTLMEAES